MKKITRPPTDFLSLFLASFPRTLSCDRCGCQCTYEYEDVDLSPRYLCIDCPGCDTTYSLGEQRGVVDAVRAHRADLEAAAPPPPPPLPWFRRWLNGV